MAITRRLCLAFVAMGLIGAAGCGENNESEGAKASAKLGDPGKADLTGVQKPAELPKSNEERGRMTKPSGTMGDQYKDKGKPAKK